jgi:hypothetical protein
MLRRGTPGRVSADRISAAERSGAMDHNSAAAPATSGTAALVPVKRW